MNTFANENMRWSIGDWNDETFEINQDRRAIVNGELLSDGAHRIEFNYIGVQTTAVVIVENGEFSETTEKYIGTAVGSAEYWGVFIEGFNRTAEGNIEVIIGS